MELKLAAVGRVLAGESVSAVAQELGIRRKRLYVWKGRDAEAMWIRRPTQSKGAIEWGDSGTTSF